MRTNKFKLNGLHCPSCIKVSKSRIGDIPGVKEVNIKDIGGETEVVADREISADEIRESLKDTGYTVEK